MALRKFPAKSGSPVASCMAGNGDDPDRNQVISFRFRSGQAVVWDGFSYELKWVVHFIIWVGSGHLSRVR